MSQSKADNDKIVSFSQMVDGEGLASPNLFGIPEPPPGFNAEAHPVFTNEEAIPDNPNKPKPEVKKTARMLAKARVFIVGRDGNEEFQDILTRGMSGELVLAKKEVSDIKESSNFKVYLEWMEPER
jgi:hypothetical protein